MSADDLNEKIRAIRESLEEIVGPEWIDTGIPFDGRKELPEPDYEGEMLLQSHRHGELERVEIRLSMTHRCYEGLERKANEHGVGPVNLMADLVEVAAGQDQKGWFTGLTVDFTGAPGKEG